MEVPENRDRNNGEWKNSVGACSPSPPITKSVSCEDFHKGFYGAQSTRIGSWVRARGQDRDSEGGLPSHMETQWGPWPGALQGVQHCLGYSRVSALRRYRPPGGSTSQRLRLWGGGATLSVSLHQHAAPGLLVSLGRTTSGGSQRDLGDIYRELLRT